MKAINIFNSVSVYGVVSTVVLYRSFEDFPRLADDVCEEKDLGDTWMVAAPCCELFPISKAVNKFRDPAIFGQCPTEVCHEGLGNFPKSHTDNECEIWDFQSWHLLAAPSCLISCPVNIFKTYKENFALYQLKKEYGEIKALEISKSLKGK